MNRAADKVVACFWGRSEEIIVFFLAEWCIRLFFPLSFGLYN